MDADEPPVRPTIGIDVRPLSILVRVQGDLDHASVPRFARVLDDVIARRVERSGARRPRMTIDLEAVGLVSAAGMTVLLRTQDDADRHGIECLICVSARARRALALTGLDHVLLTDPRSRRRVG